MKKLAVMVLILAAAAAGYFLFVAKSQPVRIYEDFADALAYLQWDEAASLTGETSAARLKVMARKLKPKLFGGATWSVVGTSYRLESEAENPDGTVELRLTQVVRITGDGEESAFGRPVVHRHSAKLERTGEGWRVISFEDKIED